MTNRADANWLRPILFTQFYSLGLRLPQRNRICPPIPDWLFGSLRRAELNHSWFNNSDLAAVSFSQPLSSR